VLSHSIPRILSTLEATAPCRLELVGGPFEEATGTSPDGLMRLAVALDRRVFCRVEPRESGVEIHSKDTGERVTAEDAGQIVSGPAARVARILVGVGVRSGVRVVTQVRVPEDAGLGTAGALEVALLAAIGLDGTAIREQIRAVSQAPESDRHAALFGGAHALRRRGGAETIERVKTDPARLEECLLLVDPGFADSPLGIPTSGGGTAAGVVEALEAGAYDEVATILTKFHRGSFDSASPTVRKVVEAIELAGGAAWPSGRLLAVWATPGVSLSGPREAISSTLKAAGVRLFPVRVDLRGLEVE
jgi:hypothetical protein